MRGIWAEVLAVALVIGTSCTPTQITQSSTVKQVTGSVEVIEKRADEIKAVTREGRKQAPQLLHWDWIDGHDDAIKQATKDLRTQLAAVEKERATQDKTVKQLQDDNKKLRDENTNSARWLWRLLVGLSALSIAGGLGLVFLGSWQTGGAVVAFGVSLAAVAQFFLQWGWVLALSAGAVLVGALLVVGWQVWEHREALVETITNKTPSKTTEKLTANIKKKAGAK